MTQEQMEVGDYAIHGEEPYTFAHYNIKHETHPLMKRRTTIKSGKEEQGRGGVILGKDPESQESQEKKRGGEEEKRASTSGADVESIRRTDSRIATATAQAESSGLDTKLDPFETHE